MSRRIILFPKGATNEERMLKWHKIAEIKDADFGFNTPKEKQAILDSASELYYQMMKMRFALLNRKNMVICNSPVAALTTAKI